MCLLLEATVVMEVVPSTVDERERRGKEREKEGGKEERGSEREREERIMLG